MNDFQRKIVDSLKRPENTSIELFEAYIKEYYNEYGETGLRELKSIIENDNVIKLSGMQILREKANERINDIITKGNEIENAAKRGAFCGALMGYFLKITLGCYLGWMMCQWL